MGAVAAVGAGADDALAFGPAAQADVEKAAEGEAEKTREDCSQDSNHDPRLSIRLRIDGWFEICGFPPIPQKKAEWMGHGDLL